MVLKVIPEKKHYQLLDKFLISKKLEKNIETNKDIDSFKNQIITIINKKPNPLDLIVIEQKYNTLKLQFILNYLINYQKNNIDLLLLHKNSFILENSCCNSKITNMIDYIKKYNVFNNKAFKSLFNKFDNKSNFYQNLIEYYSIKNTQLVTTNNTKVKYSIVLNEDFSEKVMLEYIYENSKFPQLLIIKSKNITYEQKLEHLKQYIRDALQKDLTILFKEILYKKSNKDNEDEISEKQESIQNKQAKLNLLSEKYSLLFKDFEHEISKVDDINDYDNNNLIQILITILNNPTELDIRNIDKYVGKRINKIGNILKTIYGYRNIIEKINDICNFEKIGEDLYISREIETYSYKNQFLKRCCLDIAKVYPQLVIKSDLFRKIEDEDDDFKNYKSYVEHWNLANYHYINIETKYINPELYFLVKDSDIGVLQENKIKLESNELLKLSLNVIYDIIDLMPILINNKNLSLLSKIYKLIFMIIILIYFKFDTEEENDLTKNLIDRYFEAIYKRKNILNISDITLKNNIEKLKEDEKDDMTKKFKNMTPEQRRVENLFKEHKLEHWNLGQTKNLFKYDKDIHQKRLKEKRAKELREELENVVGDQEKKEQYDALTSEIISQGKRTAHDDEDVRVEMKMIDEGINEHQLGVDVLDEEAMRNSILDEGQGSLFDIKSSDEP